MGFFDEAALTEEVAAVGVELEGLAEDAQGAGTRCMTPVFTLPERTTKLRG